MNEIVNIINAIDNVMRLTILIYLYKNGPKTCNQIVDSSGEDADFIAYHLSILKEVELISKNQKKYSITEKGKETIEKIQVIE